MVLRLRQPCGCLSEDADDVKCPTLRMDVSGTPITLRVGLICREPNDLECTARRSP